MQINNYNSSHRGTQPIRVLEHNILYALEQTHPGFLALTQQSVDQGIFYPGIQYIGEEAALFDPDSNGEPHMPYLAGGKVMYLHESFLSYLWCISYSLVTLYEEQVAKPDQNRLANAEAHPINPKRIQDANALFRYACSLITSFSTWPHGLSNPETYEQTEATWIETINGVYTAAAQFIMLHEFAHSLRQHSVQMQDLEDSGANEEELYQLSRQLEREADAFAADSMQQGYQLTISDGQPIDTKTTSDTGALIGLCALIFIGPSVSYSTTHPSPADRIDSLLQTIQPSSDSQLWGLACVALKLWASQFGHQLSFPAELDTYEDLYRMMLTQARQMV